VALTAAERADIRFFCGWSARFRQTDSRLEQAMNALDGDATTILLFTNTITATPPGLLALARDVLTQIKNSTKRLKASKVGSIELNSMEMEQLRDLGRQYTNEMCAILGVARRVDVFAASGANSFAGLDGMEIGGNYIGK
jgi:hypothetical protein